MLILACSISNAASALECAVTDSQGITKSYLLNRNIPADFDGAKPTTEFSEKGINFGTQAYCRGSETQSKPSEEGSLRMSGTLMNSNAACELHLDSTGTGKYILKIRPMSMSGSVKVISFEVKCEGLGG
jgi:hypothetical protein